MNLYYENTLYPLQNKILAAIDSLDLPFYLTGGTALSRGYFNHRYSDDLDFFVNQEKSFVTYAEKIVQKLALFDLQINTRSDSFYSLIVDKILKIDLVSDTGGYYGEVNKNPLFSRWDNQENILANKLSALVSREEPKDVADIWVIGKNNRIDWPAIFGSANSKAVGIFPPTVAEKLKTFPLELLDKIKWVKVVPKREVFVADLAVIIRQILAL
jgi:hypothetical protein